MFKGAAYLCNSKLCSLLDQRQRLVGLAEAQEPGIVYQGHIANKRAPGMEFLGKRSLDNAYEILPYDDNIF